MTHGRGNFCKADQVTEHLQMRLHSVRRTKRPMLVEHRQLQLWMLKDQILPYAPLRTTRRASPAEQVTYLI